jgi:putative PEP-CTERM system TPR-repeat lipoprotein
MRCPTFPTAIVSILLLAGAAGAAANGPFDPRSEKAYGEARRALDAGDLRTAQIHLRNAVRHDPSNLEARYELGMVNLRMGDLAAAEKDLQQAIAGGFPAERVLADYGTVLLQQQKFDKLLADIRPGDRPPALEAKLRVLRAAAHTGLRQNEAAERVLREALVIAPVAAAHVGLGRSALARRDARAALTQAEAALALEPGNADALVLRGDALRGSGDAGGARAAFDRAVELAPRHVAARVARAELAIAEGRVEDVRAESDAILQINAKHPHGLYLRALVLAQTGDSAKASETLQQITSFVQSFPAGQFLSAIVNVNIGRPQQAESDVNQVVSARPGHVPARRLLAALLLRRGEGERALQTLLPVRQAGSGDAGYLALLGEVFMRLRRFEEATQVLEEATRIDPSNGGVQANLGASNLGAGHRDLGLQQLEAALARDPRMGDAGNLLVLTLIRDGRTDRARVIVDGLRERLKDSPIPAFYLGLIAQAEGQAEESEAAFREALRIAPGFRPASAQLAGGLATVGRFDEAVALLSRQLEATPRSVETMMGLAGIELRRGAAPRAQQWLERAITTDERAMAPRIALAELLIGRGDGDKALVVARGAFDAAPQDPRGAELMGRVHLAGKDPMSAASMFRRAATLAPGQALPQLRLAEALRVAGDIGGARTALDEAIRLQPGALGPWTERVALELRQSGRAEAMRVVERLRGLHPAAAPGDIVLGDLHLGAGDHAAARRAYEAALAKGAGGEAALRDFVARLRGGEPPEGAIGFARAWLERFPRDLPLRHALAALLTETRRDGEAIVELEAVLRLAPGEVIALNNLAWLYAQRQDGRARDLAARAHALAPSDPNVADTYGWILTRSGDPARGIALLRQAAAGAPESGQIRYHLAAALAGIGERDEARRLLGETLAAARPFPGRDEAARLLESLR